MNRRDTRVNGRAGFTLIEIILTIIILGSLSLILIPFYQAIVHSPDPMIRERAVALGQAMMDEILSKRWDENSPVGGLPICTDESPNTTVRPSLVDACITSASDPATLGPDGEALRTTYDDVDDYTDIDEDGSFTDQSGATVSLPGYKRQVTVEYIPSANNDTISHDQPAASATPTDSKRIVVTITTPQQEVFYFVSVVCNL